MKQRMWLYVLYSTCIFPLAFLIIIIIVILLIISNDNEFCFSYIFLCFFPSNFDTKTNPLILNVHNVLKLLIANTAADCYLSSTAICQMSKPCVKFIIHGFVGISVSFIIMVSCVPYININIITFDFERNQEITTTITIRINIHIYI